MTKKFAEITILLPEDSSSLVSSSWRENLDASRIVTSVAFNFILAIFIFSLTLMIYGKTILQPKVSLVEENSPAEISGVLTDDLITHIDQASSG